MIIAAISLLVILMILVLCVAAGHSFISGFYEASYLADDSFETSITGSEFLDPPLSVMFSREPGSLKKTQFLS